MQIDCKTFELLGKMLFEKVILTPPFKQLYLMENQACFVYIMEGEYSSIAEIGKIKASSEESVLMKCGTYIPTISKSQDSNKYQAVAVHFYPEILRKIYDHKLPDFLKKKKENSGIGISKLNSDILIKKYIDGLLFYFENPGLVTEEILELKLKEIILLLNQTKNAPAIQAILTNLFNPISYKFREIVESHYYSNVTLDDLAQLTNMSLSTFKREFKKIYKVAPATYLRKMKLEKSIELLSSTNLRATEIAYDCGFTNISHFSRSFKEAYGISPTDYKLNHFGKPLN